MIPQMLDLVAWQVQHGAEILERGEATDSLARCDDAASELGVQGRNACNGLGRGMVEVDETAVVGTKSAVYARRPRGTLWCARA